MKYDKRPTTEGTLQKKKNRNLESIVTLRTLYQYEL